MMIINKKSIFIIIVILLFGKILVAQSRSTINDGVDKYEQGDFVGATEKFNESINEKFENFRGHFNLGASLFQQEKYEDALGSYKNALSLSENNKNKSEVYFNIGNSLLKLEKLKESVGAYTESLKLNPNDMDAKYNLSYVLKKMQEQQQQDKNEENKEDKEENQDKDQDKNDQQQDENKDKEDKNDKQDKENDKKDENKQNQEKQVPPPEISKEEAKRILDALKDDEKEMQKELRKKKGKKVKVEKDW